MSSIYAKFFFVSFALIPDVKPKYGTYKLTYLIIFFAAFVSSISVMFDFQVTNAGISVMRI